eukprot:UN23993
MEISRHLPQFYFYPSEQKSLQVAKVKENLLTHYMKFLSSLILTLFNKKQEMVCKIIFSHPDGKHLLSTICLGMLYYREKKHSSDLFYFFSKIDKEN